jgi:hypothetical protein
VAGAALVTTCVTAQAQAVTSSLQELSRLVQPGHRIEVITTDGSVVTGALTRVSDAGLTVDVAGKSVDLPAGRLDQVSRRGDPVRDGLFRGLGIGALGGLIPSAVIAGQLSESDDQAAAPVFILTVTLIGAGVGAAVGAAIDAAREGKTLVFRAEPPRASIVPILGPTRKGLALTLRF